VELESEGQAGNVRGMDVFIVNPITPPAENLIELLLLIDAVKRSSADRITAVIPYLGYNRQERKHKSRVPVSAKVIQRQIADSGADRVLVCDLHSEATLSNFDPLGQDEIYVSRLAVPYLKGLLLELDEPFIVVSPDTGGTKRASKYARLLGQQGYAVFDKGERPDAGKLGDDMLVIGDIKDKHVLIVDDIIDSGGTIALAAKVAKREGAKSVTVFAAHAVFSGDAVGILDTCEALDRVVVTDTIRHDPERLATKRLKKITVLSTGQLFAEAILRIHIGQSISEMIPT
jgi:ribose-phosphate pyrophosphokinase